VQSGYRVPAGFVIPIDAFRRTCAALDLGAALAAINEGLARRGDVARMGEPVRSRLLEGRISQAVLAPILGAVDRLALWENNTAGVLVRSSATVEDGAAHSFAGIFESIPIGTPEALEQTIREVWSSVFSPRALSYCREVGLTEVPGMAVVVQRFLEAERSGVMFTRFSGRTLVEHVEGGCEKLVKGEVTPEQLWIPGPGKQPTDTGSLPIEHARELSRLAESLEQAFGAPQDVEWVLFEDAVHVVQSRPITTTATLVSAAVAPMGLGDSKPFLRGIPASGGWGTGPVQLVFNIDDALALESGQVLVTPMTNPDMVVAMRKSAAIVTDVGGVICHAAIVSRELGLPCVVGTAAATTTLRTGDIVTVAGTEGAVYRGRPEGAGRPAARRPAEWTDVWARWTTVTADRPDLIPIISSIDALTGMPPGRSILVLAPDVDLRCDPAGLWVDLEGMSVGAAGRLVDDYLVRVADLVERAGIKRLYLLPHDPSLSAPVAAALRRIGKSPLQLHADAADAPMIVLVPGLPLPAAGSAIPLAAAASCAGGGAVVPALAGMEAATAAGLDTLKFFGHQPGTSRGPMPAAARRRDWWQLLPEYGRFHQEFSTAGAAGDHTWLEVRPELVISALLKSLVQPGFEMVPRVMGFPGLPPMHTKWIKCRYHFRSDSFALAWQAIVRGTWNAEYMADLMRRIRTSYRQLGEVLVLFPDGATDLAALTPERMVALMTSWWPRWVEFFALCWFIQAQGDDIVYPFLEETVGNSLERVSRDSDDFAWPGLTDLVAPTTPVMSGAYMASVGQLREALVAAGLTTTEDAMAALAAGRADAAFSERLARHLEQWHWMRDRDLLFEPWDTPRRVIDTALKTDPHTAAPYQANLWRNRMALSVHFDLAHAAGRAGGLNMTGRLLHDLNVERENHHVLWLKYSYPLRRLVLEIERRFVTLGSLEPGDVFFLQAPELIEATGQLPAPLPQELVRAVKNRRQGYRHEAKLARVAPLEPTREDDYY